MTYDEIVQYIYDNLVAPLMEEEEWNYLLNVHVVDLDGHVWRKNALFVEYLLTKMGGENHAYTADGGKKNEYYLENIWMP